MAALKVTDLGDYLREQRQHARMSLRQLAEQAGVSNPYLSQIERGLRKPSAEVLQQIAKGLRISAEALYVRAGILEERGDRVEVEAAILSDPHLSERQRRVLLDIYESFRAENERDADTQVASPASPADSSPTESSPSQSSPSEPGTTATKSARKRASAPSESVGSKPAKSATGESEPRKSARKAAKRAARTVAGRATSAQRRAAKKSTTDSDSQSQGGN